MSFAVSHLETDPEGWRINGCSFQQDALVSFGDYQYVCFYGLVDKNEISGDRYVVLGRRQIGGADDSDWDYITFTDYIQRKDDGHNIVSMGISGDGVIHLSWDMHGDGINYRSSVVGLANNTSADNWSTKSFSKVFKYLEGEDGKHHEWNEITYPRFLTLPSGDMLFEFRIGRSGLGDEWLYRYTVKTGKWKPVATPYIQGVENNAYLHGFDYCKNDGRLHVTWTYRDFVEDREVDDDGKTGQAGPNGPENNHDLYYAYSPDEGITWFNNENTKLELPINIYSPNMLVVEVPKYSGIMNQEGQISDNEGGVHVLGRSNDIYYHYYRNPKTGNWITRKILDFRAPVFGARGKLAVSKTNTLYALLPLEGFKFAIVEAKGKPTNYSTDSTEWDILEIFENMDGEPLIDRYRSDGVLSIFQREAEAKETTVRSCLVIDYPIS